MKTKNRILTVISVVAVAIIVLSQTSFAKTFTPARDEFPFPADGVAGLSYNTFNNFSGNNAIEDAPRFGHEREFTTVTKCVDKANDLACELGKTADNKIIGEADEWMNMQDGDIMEFGIYFHNNGEDPYDGNIPGPTTDAQGVEIGVDFKDPYTPTGFIYSRDSTYKKSGKTVNYQSGDYWHETDGGIGKTVRTISDDVLLHSYSPITIEILPELTNLYMAYDHDNNGTLDTYYYNFVPTIEKPGTINAKVVTTTHNENIAGDYTFKNFPIKVYRIYDQVENKVYLHFDKIPGCLRYAGFAYFRAKIHVEQPENPNFCTSLTLTKQTQQTCNPNTKFTAFTAKVNFTSENVPEEQYIVFDSTDKKAKLTLLPPNQTPDQKPITEFPSKPQKVIGKFIAGMYDGIGTITATYTDTQGKPIEGLVAEEGTGNTHSTEPGYCTGSISTCTDDCVDICVERPTDIPAGSLSQFSAEATGYYGDTWSGDIQYFAEKGKGKFYKGKESDVIAQIKKDFPGANPYENPNLILGCDNLINIVITPQNILNLIKNTFSPEYEANFTPQEEDIGVETTTLPQYNFVEPIELPENYQIQEAKIGGDPNPIDTKKFMNSVLMALDLKTYQPKSQDIDVKTGLDISTSTGGQNLKTADQNDLKGALDLNDLDIGVSQDYLTPDVADLPKGTFTLPSNNDEPLNPFANYESPVTAEEEEQIWFYAAEEGDDSIIVFAADTLNPDCLQKFDVSAPPACQEIAVSVLKSEDHSPIKCIPENEEIILGATNITLSNGKKANYDFDNIKTLWSATDTAGKFFEFPANINLLPKEGKNSIETEKLGVTYTGKGSVSCKIKSINNFAEPANTPCTYTVPACPPEVIEKCGNLDLKFNEIVDPVASNKITTIDKTKTAEGAAITMAVTSDKNADYPSSITWVDTTGGELVFPDQTKVTKTTTEKTIVYVSQYPAAGNPTLKNSKQAGTLTASVQGEESVCSSILNVIEIEVPQETVCRWLETQVQIMGANEWTPPPAFLSTANNYYIKNILTYSPDIDENLKLVDYTTSKGYFAKAVKIGEEPIANNLPPWLVTALNSIIFPGDTGWVQELKGVPASQQVIFVPQKEGLTPGIHPAAITITASDSTKPACTKTISLLVPPESKEACKSISLIENKWPPDKIKIQITGILGDYNGDFLFSLEGTPNGTYLSLDDQSDQTKPQSLQVNTDQALTGIYILNPSITTNWQIVVKGVGENGLGCFDQEPYTPPTIQKENVCTSLTLTPSSWVIDENDDEQKFEVSVIPSDKVWTIKWNVEGGENAYFEKGKTVTGSYTNTLKNYSGEPTVTAVVDGYEVQCHDSSEAVSPSSDKIPPSMKKKVASGEINDIESGDWDDVINVSGNTGKENRPDQFITYKISYKNGKDNDIKSVLIKDEGMNSDGQIESEDFKGTLDFYEMVIEIDGKEIDEDKICEYKEKKNGDLELDDPTHICVTNEDKDAKDWEDLEKAFQTDGLIFNNLRDDTDITIFYQMENNTALNDATCKTLDPEKDGCGEEFKNKASFEAYTENDLEGDHSKYDDTDSTTVIAVCPYVLTRASGDTFFNTPLQTGTDVAYCSKQKNIPAPIITPIEPPNIIAKMGGTEAQPTLLLPSHDICKYSNVTGGENPSDYQNPFTHFSSTICEMKAEIAEDWMKENVIDQINTNAEKVSLWSQPQSTYTLETALQLSSPTNGIFRWDNRDLTIKGASYSRTSGKFSKYTIEKNPAGSIPAAQTYIIMNADLYINSDIVYGSTTTPTDLKSYPSAAFIVINGNIHVATGVERLDGTYIAIDTDAIDRITTGQVISEGGDSYSRLTINGSLIGDVTNLFTYRKYVGNVASDEGSVTIKYNENLLLNPPPGLSKLMDVRQLEVAY